MRGNRILAEAVAEVPREPLRHSPRVHEDQRRSMAIYQCGEAVVVLLPDFVRHHGVERRARDLDAEVHLPTVADVHDRAAGGITSGQVLRDFLDGRLCGGQPDPLKRVLDHRRKPLEREREVGAPPRADDGVDLVDDHRPHRAQHLAAALRREEQVQRLRRRHQDVRRRPQHGGSLRGRRVAGAHRRRDPGRVEPRLLGQAVNAGAWLREVLVDVRAQRLER